MEQFDIFNDYAQTIHEENASSSDVAQVADKPVKPQVKPTNASATNILAFAYKHQRDMWMAFKHRRDCMMQVSGFASFKDFGVKPMDQITAADCIEYRGYLQSTGMSNGTVNRHMSAVSACFRFAVEVLQVMKDRPRVALLKEKKPNTRAFTKEQVRQLIAHFENEGHLWMVWMVKVGCLTGMRQGEIVSLPLSCIEWFPEEKEIYLPPEVTKTMEGRRVSLAAQGAWDAAVLLRDHIGREFTHRRFYDRWNDAKHALGYIDQPWFKFHATRHYAATNMARAGQNALTIAEQLGHASIATTTKYYHGDAKARAKATSVLEV